MRNIIDIYGASIFADDTAFLMKKIETVLNRSVQEIP